MICQEVSNERKNKIKLFLIFEERFPIKFFYLFLQSRFWMKQKMSLLLLLAMIHPLGQRHRINRLPPVEMRNQSLPIKEMSVEEHVFCFNSKAAFPIEAWLQ